MLGFAPRLFAALLLCSSISLSQTEWRMLNANPGRTSFIREETQLKPPLKLLRTLQTIRPGYISATAGEIFVGVFSASPNGCTAYALPGGGILWSASVPNSVAGMNFVPTVMDSIVLLGGQGGAGLVAVDRATGVQRWLKPISTLYSRCPVVDGDRISIIGDSLYCIDAAAGKTIWTYPCRRQGAPALDATTLYALDENALIALDKNNGALKWSVPNNGGYVLTVDDDFVYAFSDSTLYARRKGDGQTAWSWNFGPGTPVDMLNAISITPDHVIFSMDLLLSGSGRVVALDRSSGTVAWSRPVPMTSMEMPTAANQVVYFTNYTNGQLWGLDERDGSVLFIDSTDSYVGQPIIANHQLFVATHNGVRVFVSGAVGVEEITGSGAARERGTEIAPNPCRDEAWITFSTNRPGNVRLRIHDALGRIVETLADGACGRGRYRVIWTPRGLPAGVYYFTLTAPGGTSTGKILRLR